MTRKTIVAILFTLTLCLAHASAAERGPSTRPSSRTFQFEYTIDTTETPELKEWAETLRPEIDKWYPIFVELLASDGFSAPRQFSITFKNMQGVAYCSGTRIVGSAAWFKAHPDDRGAIIHETIHVIQQYRGRGNPGWLVEGLTDYLRWFKYEPVNKRPRPNPARAKYTDSYQTTAAFLEYVATHHNHEIAVRFNAAMRQGRYSPELWKEFTGKTVDELWAEYIETLKKK